MNTLYFVRFVKLKTWTTLVFCLTAADEVDATVKGRGYIAEDCRDQYNVERVEAICSTPDTVEGFEPC